MLFKMVLLFQRIFDRFKMELSWLLVPRSKRKVLHSRINGYDILVFANEDVGRSICTLGRYELAETLYLQKMLDPGSVCIDIGANIGYYTLLLSQLASLGSVHAFEPIPLTAALLKTNVELNGFQNIHINQCAVADFAGVIPFSLSTDSAFSSLNHTGRKQLTDTISVTVTTIDDYIELKGIDRVDFIKADVEGAESLILSGATRLFSDANNKPSLVLLELYEENLKVFNVSVDLVVDKMYNFGYLPFVLSDSGNLLQLTDELKLSHYNIFFMLA